MSVACVAVVSVSFSQAGFARGHGAKRSKKTRSAASNFLLLLAPCPRAYPAWLKETETTATQASMSVSFVIETLSN